jgi:hypothetical protein
MTDTNTAMWLEGEGVKKTEYTSATLIYGTEYIFYCKRAILFLSSGRRGGWAVNILEDERNKIALLQ